MPTELDTPEQKRLKDLLSPLVEPYKDYACPDALTFRGNIASVVILPDGTMGPRDKGPERDVLVKQVQGNVKSKTEVDQQFEAFSAGAMLGADVGYTEDRLKALAENIDAARTAICTTFAISGTYKLLTEKKADPVKYQDIERIEMFARQASYTGTHCFVVLNRLPGSNPHDPKTWGPKAVIFDPWMRSLQNPGVFNPSEFYLTGLFKGQLEINYDSTNPDLAQQKAQQKQNRQQMRSKYTQLVEAGNLEALKKALESDKVPIEDIHLGIQYETLLTQAIQHNHEEMLAWLWRQLKDPDNYRERYGQIMLKKAIEHNNLKAVKFLFEHGVDLLARVDFQGVEIVPPIKQAFNLARNIGNDEIFKFIFEQEVPANLQDADLYKTLSKLPVLKTEQNLFINVYLSQLPDYYLDGLLDQNKKTIAFYQYIKDQVINIDQAVLSELPEPKPAPIASNPFLRPTQRKIPEIKVPKPDPSSGSNSESEFYSPQSSPDPSPEKYYSAEESPPPSRQPSPQPPAPPPLPKSSLLTKKKSVELSLAEQRRKLRASKIKILQNYYRDHLNFELSTEVIKNLDATINQAEQAERYFIQFKKNKERQSAESVDALPSAPKNPNRKAQLAAMEEFKEALDLVLSSVEAITKSFFESPAKDLEAFDLEFSPEQIEVLDLKLNTFSLQFDDLEKKLKKLTQQARQSKTLGTIGVLIGQNIQDYHLRIFYLHDALKQIKAVRTKDVNTIFDSLAASYIRFAKDQEGFDFTHYLRQEGGVLNDVMRKLIDKDYLFEALLIALRCEHKPSMDELFQQDIFDDQDFIKALDEHPNASTLLPKLFEAALEHRNARALNQILNCQHFNWVGTWSQHLMPLPETLTRSPQPTLFSKLFMPHEEACDDVLLDYAKQQMESLKSLIRQAGTPLLVLHEVTLGIRPPEQENLDELLLEIQKTLQTEARNNLLGFLNQPLFKNNPELAAPLRELKKNSEALDTEHSKVMQEYQAFMEQKKLKPSRD